MPKLLEVAVLRTRCARVAGAGAIAVALGLALFAHDARASTPDEDAARAAVQDTIDRVLAILGDDALSLDQKKDQVEAIAIDSFDFDVISRLVLARNYKKFDDRQRSDFTEAFKRHLSATYRDTLDTFSDEAISIESTRPESNGDVTVRSAIHLDDGDNVRVDYRCRKRGERWLGIDVIVEGVSLVQNFRAQAQEIVSNDGPDALIERLNTKVHEAS